MKIYLAPLEGITGYTYRRALYQCFGGFDKYFIPFILPNQKGHLSTREKKDIMPENNEGMYAVPQILTKNAEVQDFWTGRMNWTNSWMRFSINVI